MSRWKMWINGQWVQAQSGRTRVILDPATENEIAEVPEGGPEDVNAAVAAARAAFDQTDWRRMGAIERGRLLFRIAEGIARRKEELAEVESRNTGKPIAQARYDMQDAVDTFEYYGGLCTKLTGQTLPVPGNNLVFTRREPIGVVAQISAWNFPLQLVSWKLAPALAAGCTAVVKPSELTPLTAILLGEILEEAGVPAGVVNIVLGDGAGVGRPLVQDRRVNKIAFTGGTATGQEIMRAAADGIKRVTLELGGKSPQIIFADADLDAAVQSVLSMWINAGQVCSAGSRVLVHASLHDRLVAEVVAATQKLKLGTGLNPETNMGPQISANQRTRVAGFVERAKAEGAQLVLGGRVPPHMATGYFYEPTIFTGVRPEHELFQEEVFGPVLAVTSFKTDEEAVRLANHSRYGLGAGIWTRDITRAHRVAEQIEAGMVWVNTFNMPSIIAPWGGYKESGIGRELGTYGIESYLETKQVWIDLSR